MEESGHEFDARTVYGQTHSTCPFDSAQGSRLRSAQGDKGVAARDGDRQSVEGLL